MNTRITRRSLLLAPTLVGAPASFQSRLASSSSEILTTADEIVPALVLHRSWSGSICKLSIGNPTRDTHRLREVVVFDLEHGFPSTTPFYAEGYQMLSQTGGTIEKPVNIGGYADARHYKLPQPEGAFTAYNVLQLPGALLAFTSCRRFIGKFHLRPTTLQVVVDLDGVQLPAGTSLDLDEFALFEGPDHGLLYEKLAARLRFHHPPIFSPQPPQGWCSWYCFGPRVTAQQVMENLEFIAAKMPSLRYIQIDDGYQSAMGDWLETGKAFGGDVRTVLRQIKERGFEPAIWVAPFIAEAKSKLFQEHPNWFMKDAQGRPLPSNEVTFGGWRMGPWYALDGTHPEALRHLENVFGAMRHDWGVTYFKLDANYWGTMPVGRLYDLRATRVEAYRRGMSAVRRGAGDAFLLGCNHPLWPSLGVIHGSRSSGDISRRWQRFAQTARENLHRAWQNGTLWWNDPDVVLLKGDLTEDEFLFHASVIYATGGMLLAGDDLPRLDPAKVEMLRKLTPPTGKAAVFDSDLRIGRLRQPNRELIFFLNWTEKPVTLETQLPRAGSVQDFWSGAPVQAKGSLKVENLKPHSARVFVAT